MNAAERRLKLMGLVLDLPDAKLSELQAWFESETPPAKRTKVAGDADALCGAIKGGDLGVVEEMMKQFPDLCNASMSMTAGSGDKISALAKAGQTRGPNRSKMMLALLRAGAICTPVVWAYALGDQGVEGSKVCLAFLDAYPDQSELVFPSKLGRIKIV